LNLISDQMEARFRIFSPAIGRDTIQGMNQRVPLQNKAAWAVVGLGLALMSLTGCGATRKPVHLVLATDASGSFAENAMPAVDAMRGTLEDLVVSGDQFTTLRFFTECEELESERPRDAQAFSDEMSKLFAKPQAERGTSFAVLAEGLVKHVSRRPQPAIVVVYTDGANDDHSQASADRLAKAAQALAAQPQLVAVVFCGVEAGNREWLRTQFAPLGGKVVFRELAPIRLAEVVRQQSSAGGREE
jgi:hypothetical protein